MGMGEEGVINAPEGSFITEDGSLVAADGNLLVIYMLLISNYWRL